MHKRVLAIINPISGTKSKESIPALLSEAYDKTDYELFITFTKYGNHAYLLAKEAVEKGFDTVIAIGGDGTINEVAKGLIGSNVNMGIIPRGSGNGLALTLNISLNVKEAINNLITGEPCAIDTCKVNEHIFLSMTGMGFDAIVSKKFADAGTRGFKTYIKTVIKEYGQFIPQRYKITLDTGEIIETKAFVVVAANGKQYGNSAYIAPRADIMDGFIDLIVLRPIKNQNIPQLLWQLFTKKLDQNGKHDTYRVKSVMVERERNECIHIDGEPLDMPKRLHIQIIPQSLKVILPQSN